jgi:FtsH-binding integral membrane protein
MNRSVPTTVGLVIAGLLGLTDLAGPLTTDGEHPPMFIALIGAALGLITVLGVVMGWRGSRAGIAAVIVTRLLSALTAVPALFVDDVPGPLRVVVVVGIAVTLLSVGLIAPALRDNSGTALPAH